MLNRYVNIAHNTRRNLARRPNSAAALQSWQTLAIAAYQQAHQHDIAALPALLATRVSALTGSPIDPAAVFVDAERKLATVVVDGMVFRAHDQQVFLLRSCVDCGSQHFESAPLQSSADLGYALSEWKPLCASCPPEDPANWLES